MRLNDHPGPAARCLAAAIALCVVLGTGAIARHRHEAGTSIAGQFDYYLLSLSWSPAFCLESPGADECHGLRSYGLIVHGLWPQNESGPRVEFCDSHRRVDDDIVDSLADLMPARGLIYHEWSAHGSCSGLDPRDYFGLVRRAYGGLAIPERLAHPTAAVTQSTAALTRELLAANPRFPDQSLIVTCTRQQDSPRLREVRVCLDRELEPRRCSADVLRSACRAPELIIPPVR